MKKIIAIVVTLILGLSYLGSPAMATSQSTTFGAPLDSNKVVFLKDCAAKEGAESVKCVLKIAADVLSAIVGILGVIGIVVTGIQYLTAGDSEEKTRKAKRRMFEIVIGLAVYAAMYFFVSWLLPDNSVSSGGGSGSSGSGGSSQQTTTDV